MKIFLFVLAATILEASGDAIVRIALHHSSLSARVGLFMLGSLLLTLYGTSLNLAPVEFASVVELYIATLFVVFQITNHIFLPYRPHACRPGRRSANRGRRPDCFSVEVN
jgi:hypothetical protein